MIHVLKALLSLMAVSTGFWARNLTSKEPDSKPLASPG